VPVRVKEEELQLLMIEAVAGNAESYQTLLTSMARLLRIYYSRRLRNALEDIEDLVQETLIAIHTRRATYDPSRSFVAWAFAVARYKMVDHLRRRRVRVSIDELDDILSDEGFEGSLCGAGRRARVGDERTREEKLLLQQRACRGQRDDCLLRDDVPLALRLWQYRRHLRLSVHRDGRPTEPRRALHIRRADGGRPGEGGCARRVGEKGRRSQ